MKVTMLRRTVYLGRAYAPGDLADVDAATAERWARHGIAESAEQKPLDKMTLSELKAYAVENGIDLGEVTKKDDVLAVVLAAQGEEEEE